MEATFYQVNIIDSQSLAPLLFKIIDQDKKALVYCQDTNKIKELDASLWSYGRNKFLPHITIFDNNFDFLRQPILLSNQQENHNQADYLILLSKAENNFIKNFNRIFYFYNDDSEIKDIKNDLLDSSFSIKSFKKDGAKWVTI